MRSTVLVPRLAAMSAMLLSTAPSDIDAAALAACANEPIHIPGTIQSRGILLALDVACETILIVSANASTHFGVPINAMLGRSASALFGFEQWLMIRSRVGAARDRVVVPIPSVESSVLLPPRAILAHRNDDRVIVELIDESQAWASDPATHAVQQSQLSPDQHLTPIAQPTDPLAVAAAFQRVATTLAADPDLSTLAESTANEVRRFTGYDRVMIYQFDISGNGTVIAEARRDDLEPFLGLHYPASDIPAQARELYLRTRVRVLESAEKPQVALLAHTSVAASRPLDLSASLLRSMSPIHLQYLRNMEVTATLVISIVVDGALWGLVACHHLSAKWPSFAMRAACDMLSEFISVQIAVQSNVARARAGACVSGARCADPAADGARRRNGLRSGGVADGDTEQRCGDRRGIADSPDRPHSVRRARRGLRHLAVHESATLAGHSVRESRQQRARVLGHQRCRKRCPGPRPRRPAARIRDVVPSGGSANSAMGRRADKATVG